MSGCVDRWSLAHVGHCQYCGSTEKVVFPEPFGGQDACRQCWEQIVYGEDE